MVTRTRPKATTSASKDSVAEVVAAIRAQVGEEGAMVLSDDRMAFKIKGVVPFGCLAVDRSIGRGGAPLGRLTILHGGEGSGKTTAALHLCAQAQKRGGIAVYIDKEFKLDPDWAKALGVDLDGLIMCNAPHLEAVIRLIRGVIRWASKARERGRNQPIVIVLDSINACLAKAVVEAKDEAAVHVAPEARVWSRHLPKVIEDANRENVALVFISQVRKKINVMFGDDDNLAGGESPKFYASCIGFFKRIGSVKDDGVRIANKVQVEWKKNQIAPPFRKGTFYVRFPPHGAGFDNERAIIDIGEGLGVVVKKGNSLVFDGNRLGVGYEQARVNLVKNPAMAEKILAAIQAAGDKHVEVSSSGDEDDDGTEDE